MTLRMAAAVMLWRARGGAGLEVYLVQRGERVLFMPGFWAFPGGKIDAQDQGPRRSTATKERGEPGPLDAQKEAGSTSEQPEADPDRAAAERCARRELFEEVGVWSWPAAPAPGAPLQQRRRAALAGDQAVVPDAAERGPARALVPLAAFVTPHFGNHRFSARYFALQAEAEDAPEVWPGELSCGSWFTPEEALALHAQATLILAPPVMATLEALAATAGEASRRVGAAQERLQDALRGERFGTVMVPRVAVAPVRSPTLPPSTHTNCYVLGARHLAVVDPGTPYPDEQAALFGYLDGFVGRGGAVREVWLTHHHPDHVGAAMALRQRYGARVSAHAETAKLLRGQVTVDAQVVDEQALAVDDEVYLAMHTPGHAGGHLCFYDRKRGHLLSGDNVLGMGTSIVMPRPEGNMRAYVQSLERLLTLRLALLLPGHGPPAALSEQRVADTLKQRYAREQMLLDLLAASHEPVAVRTLVRKLYRGLATDAHSLAAMSCLSHLEKLVDDGQVRLEGGLDFDAVVARVPRTV